MAPYLPGTKIISSEQLKSAGDENTIGVFELGQFLFYHLLTDDYVTIKVTQALTFLNRMIHLLHKMRA